MSLRPDKGVAIFTDGSASYRNRSGGWAFVAIDAYGNEEFDMGWESDTTNNRMEMAAWIRGLDFVSTAYGPCDVLVYSDSEYVGLGATDRSRKRNNNVDLWVAIDAA